MFRFEADAHGQIPPGNANHEGTWFVSAENGIYLRKDAVSRQ
jgi:hypothetical protein